MKSNILIYIFLFLFLLITLVFILTFFFLTKKKDNNPIVQNLAGGNFLYFCNNQPCAENFVCDPLTLLCKYPYGATCSSSFDCANGLFCSGSCVTGPTGSLNNYCPCEEGYVCDKSIPNNWLCKGNSGTTCNDDSDCFSRVCVQNTCVPGLPNSYPCVSDSDCANNNCSIGFCQDQDVTTGEELSQCSGECINIKGAKCDKNLVCLCLDGENFPGTCIREHGLLESCQGINDPGLKSVCFDLFTCRFNSCQLIESSCIKGMTSSNNICLNETNIGCNENNNCYSNNCNMGTFVLNYYKFSKEKIIGSKEISLLTLEGITGISQVKKMVASSDNQLDFIFLFDLEQGIYNCLFNRENNSFLSNWNQALPLITDNGTLIDFGFNASEYIVCFLNNNNYVLYSGLRLDQLTPFNYSGAGVPGLQYAYGMPIENINYVDISSDGDVIIVNDQGTYLKKSSDLDFSFYVTSTGVTLSGYTGLARFYSGESDAYLNLAYVSSDGTKVLFSGDNSSYIIPGLNSGSTSPIVDFSIFTEDYVIVLTEEGKLFTLIKKGRTYLPFNTNKISRVLAVNENFYVLTLGYCS